MPLDERRLPEEGEIDELEEMAQEKSWGDTAAFNRLRWATELSRASLSSPTLSKAPLGPSAE